MLVWEWMLVVRTLIQIKSNSLMTRLAMGARKTTYTHKVVVSFKERNLIFLTLQLRWRYVGVKAALDKWKKIDIRSISAVLWGGECSVRGNTKASDSVNRRDRQGRCWWRGIRQILWTPGFFLRPLISGLILPLIDLTGVRWNSKMKVYNEQSF